MPARWLAILVRIRQIWVLLLGASEVLTWVKMSASLWPIVTTKRRANAISPTSRPYSTAVAPRSVQHAGHAGLHRDEKA